MAKIFKEKGVTYVVCLLDMLFIVIVITIVKFDKGAIPQ